MIISASRRTDILAFYARWLMNRVRAGYCLVPNPFNPAQISRVSLRAEDVDAIVFWTRNPGPLIPHFDELGDLGLPYYIQVTVIGYPREIDPGSPSLASALKAFESAARRIGPDRLVWRYDPIVFCGPTDVDFHRERFRFLARSLAGCTRRAVISFVRVYGKVKRRLTPAQVADFESTGRENEAQSNLLRSISRDAAESGMEVFCCAEERDLRLFGILPGRCIDADLISRLFGIAAAGAKDPSQRPACGCAVSKDIGMYDSCLFGCKYCYATSSPERARRNHRNHDPRSAMLIGQPL